MTEEVTDPNTGEIYTYYMEPRLKKYLDYNVFPDLNRKDKDFVIMIDGYEGAGKSTLGQQIGRYIDPTLSLDRICMSPEDFRNAIIGAKKGQCVIYDEAVTGMSAGESLSKVGKMLKSLMMQMRQKNLFVIIIMPWVFDFNKYAVMGRSKALFHVYERMGRRGYFRVFNRKDTRMTYLLGKKTYTYKIMTRFKGRFYGKYTIDEEAYRKKKEENLKKTTQEEQETTHKWKIQRNILIEYLKSLGKPNTYIAKILEEGGAGMSDVNVGLIVGTNTVMLDPSKPKV